MKKVIFSLVATLLLSLGVLAVVLFNTSPQDGAFNLFAFYFCLLILIWSVLVIIMFLINRKTADIKEKRLVLLRRGLIIALIVISLIFFSTINVLNFLSVFTIIFAAVLFELFFINRTIEKSK